MFRWVRTGKHPGVWQPWWLLGLVEVVTYPQPCFQRRMEFRPGFEGIVPARLVPVY